MFVFTWRWTKCLEKSGKRNNFVLEKTGKPQSDFCMNPASHRMRYLQYLVGRFQWNLAQILIMSVGTAERFSGSEVMVVTKPSVTVTEACILTVWRRGSVVFVCLNINRIYWSKMCFIGHCLPYHWRLSSSPTTHRGSVIACPFTLFLESFAMLLINKNYQCLFCYLL